MIIGIGGAGGKIAALSSDNKCIAVNVSELELSKLDAKQKILAVTHSSKGQLRGSGKNPKIGRLGYQSIADELKEKIKGSLIFTASGGGTGNGITSEILEYLSEYEYEIPIEDKTMFAFILPYLEREAGEYVENTIDFLGGPVSSAIDSGNTGNIILFSNKLKFEGKIPELEYNKMMVDSLNSFLSVPIKGELYQLLDGHIDFEDFDLYKTKPFFNHFTHFDWDPNRNFEEQLNANLNALLLMPERPIDALFLLELPNTKDVSKFYEILDYFAKDNVSPVHGVVLNESLTTPHITVSLLYSRKPMELVNDFKKAADQYTRNRIKKSLEQHVILQSQPLDKMNEARRLVEETGSNSGDVLGFLKRIGKL